MTVKIARIAAYHGAGLILIEFEHGPQLSMTAEELTEAVLAHLKPMEQAAPLPVLCIHCRAYLQGGNTEHAADCPKRAAEVKEQP